MLDTHEEWRNGTPFYKKIYVFISLERGQIFCGVGERERETDRLTDGDKVRRKQTAVLIH